MGVAKNFVVKNGIEVNSNLFVANSDTSKVGIASTGPRTTLDVRGGIACTDISVSSAATFNTFNSVTGIITNAHFENVIVNGITTLSSLNLNDVRAVNVNASGIGTFAVGIVTNLSGDNLNFGDINSGVGSIAGFLFKGGIMTSTALGAGIVTYFGDGGNLSNLPGASPGGSNFQVQFNASAGGVGVFSGHSGLTYNYQTLGATSLNVSTGATFGTGINVVGGGLTVTGISTFNGNISVLTGNITLGTYNSGAQVIADQIISGAGAGAAGAQINKGVYNTRVDDDSGVEQNAFNIGNFNDLNSMQIGGRGTITTKSGIVGAGLSVTGIATCNGGVQIGAGQSFGANGPTAVYYGDGSNLTNLPAAGLTTEALVSSGIVTTLNLTTAQDHKVTASGITTITVSGGTEADSHTVRIINSGITTVGFSTFFLFPSGSAPSLPTADGAISLISFTVNRVGAAGTQLLAGASLNFS